MNKENCALKLVDEIILYYDARSKKHQIPQIYFSQLLTVTTPFNVCMEICAADLNTKMMKIFNKGNLTPKSLEMNVK